MAKGNRKAKGAGRSDKNGSVDQINTQTERPITSSDPAVTARNNDTADVQNLGDESGEIDALRSQLEDVQRAFTESHGAFAEQLLAMTKRHEQDMQEALETSSAEHQQQLDRLREEHREKLDTLTAEHRESLASSDAKHRNELERTEQQAKESKEAYGKAVQERDDLQAQLDNATDRIKTYDTQITSLQQQHEELLKETTSRSSAVHEEEITTLAQEKLQDIALALGYKAPDYVRFTYLSQTFMETLHAAHHAKYAKLYKELLAIR